jgi:hypothetical protein
VALADKLVAALVAALEGGLVAASEAAQVVALVAVSVVAWVCCKWEAAWVVQYVDVREEALARVWGAELGEMWEPEESCSGTGIPQRLDLEMWSIGLALSCPLDLPFVLRCTSWKLHPPSALHRDLASGNRDKSRIWGSIHMPGVLALELPRR